MKRKITKSIVLSVIALLLIASCSNEPKIKTVLNPSNTENSTTEGISYEGKVDKIILTDSMTIMDFSYKCKVDEDDSGYTLSISPKTYIVANGKKYYLIGTKNIPIGEYVESEAIRYRTITYSLLFPPIPFDTDSIGFYEECDGFISTIRGIDLTGTANTIEYKNKKDNEVYVNKITKYFKRQQEKERQRARQLEEAQRPFKCRYCGKHYSDRYEREQCEQLDALRGFANILNQ